LCEPASAQQERLATGEPQPGLPVADRPRPDFDPIGLPVGGFTLLPRLSVTGAYDDNIFASTRKTGDFYSVVAPAFDLNSHWSQHAVGVSALGAISRYAEQSREDYEAARLSGYGRLDIDRDAAVTLTARYRRDADLRSDPETLRGQLTRAMYDQSGAGLNYVQRINRVELTTRLGVDQLSYDQTINQDRDRLVFGGAERVAYLFSPRVNVFVQSGYDVTQYSRNAGGRDYDAWTNLVGTAFDIDSIVVGEIGVGVLQEFSHAPGVPDFTGFAASGKVVWNVTALTSLIGVVERASESTRIPGAFSRLRTLGVVELQHELLRNLILKAGYSYEINDYRGMNLREDTQVAALTARYLINRNFVLDATYAYRDRDSTSPATAFNTGSFSDNLVTLTLTARY
jgi:hypothetical protein